MHNTKVFLSEMSLAIISSHLDDFHEMFDLTPCQVLKLSQHLTEIMIRYDDLVQYHTEVHGGIVLVIRVISMGRI